VLNVYGDYSVNYPILTPFECINMYPIVVNDPQKIPLNHTKWEKNPQKGEKMSELRREIDGVISELEKVGVTPNSHIMNNIANLKEIIDNTLSASGISKERFKEWFGLKECNCTKRKAWLNSVLSWRKNIGDT